VRLRLLAALGDTYALPSGEHRVAARVGFACHPAAGQSGAELLAEALSARDRPPGLQG
jgi:predicted signal transduction protein with EAL and GGDEF domain